MKFLLDMPVSPRLLRTLSTFGHEGVHASLIGKQRAADEELIEIARQEGRVIITADLDFPQIISLSGAKGPGIILFRGGNYSDAEMEQLLERVLQRIDDTTIKRSICVVDKHRIRIRRLPMKMK